MHQLEVLLLSGNPLDNEALKEIGKVTSLQRLALDNTHIDDGGLSYLAPLSNLRWIDLTETGVTASGIAQLRQLLPSLAEVELKLGRGE